MLAKRLDADHKETDERGMAPSSSRNLSQGTPGCECLFKALVGIRGAGPIVKDAQPSSARSMCRVWAARPSKGAAPKCPNAVIGVFRFPTHQLRLLSQLRHAGSQRRPQGGQWLLDVRFRRRTSSPLQPLVPSTQRRTEFPRAKRRPHAQCDAPRVCRNQDRRHRRLSAAVCA